MDEFALGGDTDAMRFRLAHNPSSREHQPGGSSAGSGVAVADGLVNLALGTDTGGSVRFPASFCGVVGLKPTRGIVPLTGFVQFSKLNDTIGTLSRTVEDTARALEVLAGEDLQDEATRGAKPEAYVDKAAETGPDASELTVGIPGELFGIVPEVEAVVTASIDRLEDQGATVREVSIPDFEYAIPAWWAIAMTEAAVYFESRATNYWQCSEPSLAFTQALTNALDEQPECLGEYITDVVLYGQHLVEHHDSRYYAKAQRARQLVTTGVDLALENVDVLASPTTPMTAPKWGEGYLDDGTLVDAVKTTAPFNLTGHPAISVPCGELDGLPVGLQFIAKRDRDATALTAGATWEAVAESQDDWAGWAVHQ
jgi:Asp-tRNA(Asn)/Glu-tRNA(Gln) amidotransferase A subunit family amidase